MPVGQPPVLRYARITAHVIPPPLRSFEAIRPYVPPLGRLPPWLLASSPPRVAGWLTAWLAAPWLAGWLAIDVADDTTHLVRSERGRGRGTSGATHTTR